MSHRSQIRSGALSFVLAFFLCGFLSAQETVLVEIGDAWRYFKGTVAPPVDWAAPDFVETDWLDGTTGIGYGDGDDATTLTDMMNGYVAFFARRAFNVTDLPSITRLVLFIDYDDGFSAYLNGVEVARRGLGTAGTPIAFDQTADGHEAQMSGGVPEFIDIGIANLLAGTNVLAIELHNTAIDSTDATLRPRLIGNGSLPPTGVACTAAPGSVTINWTNSQTYDAIDIFRNGISIDSVAGDVTTYTDASPSTLDNVYSVVGLVGAAEYPSINTCTVGCTASTLTCSLSLVGGATQASVAWTPIAGATMAEVYREGALVATLTGGETSYMDPNVESDMPEDDTDFTIVQTSATGTCSVNCQMSLCPENVRAQVVGGLVELEWDNVVKGWDHFEISRGGVLIDMAVPGDATSWTDASLVPTLGSSYDYLIHPVAVAGGELPAPMDQCDLAFTFSYIPEVASYNPPPGGWDYELRFTGANKRQYNPNPGETGNLDGQWIRSIDRDGWDGSDAADLDVSAPDGPAPGGIDIVTRAGLGDCGADTSVLRILDPGDPSQPIGTAFPTPFNAPNNQRILLGLDLGSPSTNLLKSGITVVTRLRTSPDAPAYMNPQAASGDGSPISTGIGHVGVYWRNAAALPEEGLTAGASVAVASGANTGDLQLSTNPETDVDAANVGRFISVYLTVVGAAAVDTYDVNVYLNGATTPSDEVGGAGVALQGGVADFGLDVNNYLAIGCNSTADDAMIEIDYVAYKAGVHPPATTPCAGGGEGFQRGDADSNNAVNITDAVRILNVLFLGIGSIACDDAADADDNGSVNITDAVRILNVLFLGIGSIPPPTGGVCAEDPTSDSLTECVYEC
jgi:hypothetical protein